MSNNIKTREAKHLNVYHTAIGVSPGVIGKSENSHQFHSQVGVLGYKNGEGYQSKEDKHKLSTSSSIVSSAVSGQGRSLTANEIVLAKVVYKNSINYKKIKIFKKVYTVFQGKNVAVTPNGNIYYSPSHPCYLSDISLGNLWQRSFFIHELIHVWQHQQGVNVIAKKIFGPLYGHNSLRYKYKLKEGKPFSKYKMEQQGDIASDYYRVLCGDISIKYTIKEYEAILPF